MFIQSESVRKKEESKKMEENGCEKQQACKGFFLGSLSLPRWNCIISWLIPQMPI